MKFSEKHFWILLLVSRKLYIGLNVKYFRQHKLTRDVLRTSLGRRCLRCFQDVLWGARFWDEFVAKINACLVTNNLYNLHIRATSKNILIKCDIKNKEDSSFFLFYCSGRAAPLTKRDCSIIWNWHVVIQSAPVSDNVHTSKST